MRITLLLIALGLFSRCHKPDAPDCLQPVGDVVTEFIFLDQEFNSMILYDNIKLVLTNDSLEPEHIKLEGGENLLSDISFSVTDGLLTIQNNNRCNWVRSYNELTLYINNPHINSVYNYGSGGMAISYSTDSLTVEQENSLADNTIHFNGEFLEVNLHSGSGFAAVTGTVNQAYLYCNGFCSLNTNGFNAVHILANNSGDASMFVTPQSSLFAFIAGSGDIIYTGDSIDLTTEILGTGEVILSEN